MINYFYFYFSIGKNTVKVNFELSILTQESREEESHDTISLQPLCRPTG